MINKKGFTLVEALVYMFILAIVLAGLYSMIIYYRNVETTEQARVRRQQESRFTLSEFSTDLKDAGAVLTLENTGSFLKKTPYFNGIFPLNNTNFADGIIIAKGDPNAVTKLTANFNPSGTTLQVENTKRKDNPSLSAWTVGDKGIVINENGYFVFYVTGVNNTSLNIRATSVYYSGLLSTTKYKDNLISPATTKGNNINYQTDTPVIRLYNFSIFLVQEKNDTIQKRKIRELIKITDTKSQSNPLTSTTAEKGVVAENIWDIQLIYTTITKIDDPINTQKNYCASDNTKWKNPIPNPCVSGGSNTCTNFLDDIRNKLLKEVTIKIIALTDNYSGKGAITNRVPAIGDESSYTLTKGKYTYKLFTLNIAPRNFNIIM